MSDEGWVRQVLEFWFEELDENAWFTASDACDVVVRDRFGRLHERLSASLPTGALLEAGPALAATLVLDQFPRNIHRGSAAAFATDRLALAVARNALTCGFDEAMADSRRQFFYMPFMHSENLGDQTRCVELFSAMGGDEVSYAIEHRDIIERFGRFPHRNRALGRPTSDAEAEFLMDHDGFGQLKP